MDHREDRGLFISEIMQRAKLVREDIGWTTTMDEVRPLKKFFIILYGSDGIRAHDLLSVADNKSMM
jgi:hypothetical protein